MSLFQELIIKRKEICFPLKETTQPFVITLKQHYFLQDEAADWKLKFIAVLNPKV